MCLLKVYRLSLFFTFHARGCVCAGRILFHETRNEKEEYGSSKFGHVTALTVTTLSASSTYVYPNLSFASFSLCYKERSAPFYFLLLNKSNFRK